MPSIEKGALVYIDSFGGLIDAECVSVSDDYRVTVRVCETRAEYVKGETVELASIMVAPRKAVKTDSVGRYRVMSHSIFPDSSPERTL